MSVLNNTCMYVMFVCMYVCMYVWAGCIYVCMYVCMYQLSARRPNHTILALFMVVLIYGGFVYSGFDAKAALCMAASMQTLHSTLRFELCGCGLCGSECFRRARSSSEYWGLGRSGLSFATSSEQLWIILGLWVLLGWFWMILELISKSFLSLWGWLWVKKSMYFRNTFLDRILIDFGVVLE